MRGPGALEPPPRTLRVTLEEGRFPLKKTTKRLALHRETVRRMEAARGGATTTHHSEVICGTDVCHPGDGGTGGCNTLFGTCGVCSDGCATGGACTVTCNGPTCAG